MVSVFFAQLHELFEVQGSFVSGYNKNLRLNQQLWVFYCLTQTGSQAWSWFDVCCGVNIVNFNGITWLNPVSTTVGAHGFIEGSEFIFGQRPGIFITTVITFSSNSGGGKFSSSNPLLPVFRARFFCCLAR